MESKLIWLAYYVIACVRVLIIISERPFGGFLTEVRTRLQADVVNDNNNPVLLGSVFLQGSQLQTFRAPNISSDCYSVVRFEF